ncbi:adenylate/guanylate cyclase domain-containing protein [Mesorhizobium sp. WSM2561]|uniref:adenylate/guanylate cyclase domain-containing protein n=1 Tax=Mesorhizobium sp. WSM2561 TaxID=1040985 RepID=UPI0004AF7193|nr:adenylate/guanylate cyclase domain-containing protein [Mesorhizobium sp. WSM2561]
MSGSSDNLAEDSGRRSAQPAAASASDPPRLDERAGWSRPLQTLLAVTTVSLILIVSAALIGLNYYRSRAAAVEDAETSMRVFSARLVERFNALSNQTTASIGIVASVPNAFLSAPPERSDDKARLLREIISRAPHLDGAYAGYPDGSFFHVVNLATPGWTDALSAPEGAVFAIRILRPNRDSTIETVTFQDAGGKAIADNAPMRFDYDPRTRPWYKAAVDIVNPVSIGPYQMATTGKLGMTVAQSHSGNRRIVIGADIILDTITDFLAAERITPRTVAFIVDTSGNPVIHSNREFMQRLMSDTRSGDGDAIVDSIRSDDSWTDAPRVIEADGQNFLVLVTPLRSALLLAQHRIVVAAPLAELTLDAHRSLIHALLISAMVVVGAILLALVVSRVITKSLHLLTDSAQRLQSLDFATPVDVRSHVTEITSLSRAMNRARDAIFTFALYVPKEFVRKGIQSGSFTGRTASRQEVTALFTDIYDFTTISEAYSPEQVVEMLSEYFDIFEDAVTEHNGSVIQFLGDSVFAMWNAPVPDENHAENACRAAVEVERRLKLFNQSQRADGLPEFRTRFGIHTGQAVVGSVGARERLQYTAMGDTINVASRLEGMNKTYGTTILASEAVHGGCSRVIHFRSLGTAQAKGRTGSITIYEVTGMAPK